MNPSKSHIFKRPAFLVCVIMVFFIAFFWVFYSFEKSTESKKHLLKQEQLLTNIQKELSDSFQDTLQDLKTKAIQIGLSDIKDLSIKQPFLAWAELGFQKSHIKINRYVQSKDWKDAIFSAYFDSFISRLQQKKLHQGAVEVFRLKQDVHSTVELLSFCFFLKNSGYLVIVDPVSVFPFFRQYKSERASLIGLDGLVLAHSQPSYVGSSLAKSSLFQKGILQALQNLKKQGKGEFYSLDQNLVFSVFNQIDNFPLVLVIEVLLSSSYKKTQFQKTWIIFFLLIMIGFLLTYVFVKRLFSLNKPKVNLEPTKVPTIKILGHSKSILESAMADFHVVTEHRQSELLVKEDQRVNLFEKEATGLKDIVRITKRMTEVAADFTKSPCLFFYYREEIQAAILKWDAGFQDGHSPAAMSFPVKTDMIIAMNEAAQRGEIFSLTQYSPLANILLAKTGVAHFEAWPLTSYGPLGKMSGKLRLVGVLVVLQAGVDSVLHREALIRMLRTTGLIYENMLLSS
ncbi:MAG: hypothetical protein HY843_08235 [Bdellovibrio sp.]|nr:hypothetical protein [Bdellovibrio sp.]